MTTAAAAVQGPDFSAGAQLLADLRNEITRADTKATVLAGVLSMSAGLLGGLLTSSRWNPTVLTGHAGALWWTGLLAHAIAQLALLLAVMPRYRRSRWRPGVPLTYFGDIHRASRSGRLGTALTDTGQATADGLLTALAETSRIVVHKHLWIRAGLIAFGCASLLLPGALLVN
ncbi:Pycsar system effector family protein [Streptomyces sp. NPDC050732]|uniref:Pycsar system effector family protein n=1 Tax=Streptomyces sp. NPDC050732 TaxID=3154632 RepID=UPI003435DFA1